MNSYQIASRIAWKNKHSIQRQRVEWTVFLVWVGILGVVVVGLKLARA